MLKVTIFILAILMSVVVYAAYTAPNPNSIMLEVGGSYTAPNPNSLTLTVGDAAGAADSCTYTSGDWNINCADNCVISSPVDVGGNDVFISGSGNVTLSAKVSNYDQFAIHGTSASAQCIVTCYNGVCGE